MEGATAMLSREGVAGDLPRTARQIVGDNPASAPPLASENVQLRWLRIADAETRHLDRWFGLLAVSEQVRAMQFRNRGDRVAYVAAHALLRRMLSDALGGDPRAWAFEIGSFGKPALAAPHLRLRPHFNISHTRGLVACAIASVPVGVDVEASKVEVSLAVAEHFASSERAMLAKAAGDERQAMFFRLWTLKEAYLKATGEGLSGRLNSPVFQLDPLRVTFDRPEDPGCWQFFEYLPCDEYRLALAMQLSTPTPVQVLAAAIDPNEVE